MEGTEFKTSSGYTVGAETNSNNKTCRRGRQCLLFHIKPMVLEMRRHSGVTVLPGKQNTWRREETLDGPCGPPVIATSEDRHRGCPD